MAERLQMLSTTAAHNISCTPRDALAGIRSSFRQSLLNQAETGEAIRLPQSQTLKLLSMLLSPSLHNAAVHIIERGFPSLFANEHAGHCGEALSMLYALGVTEDFGGKVCSMWRDMYAE